METVPCRPVISSSNRKLKVEWETLRPSEPSGFLRCIPPRTSCLICKLRSGWKRRAPCWQGAKHFKMVAPQHSTKLGALLSEGLQDSTGHSPWRWPCFLLVDSRFRRLRWQQNGREGGLESWRENDSTLGFNHSGKAQLELHSNYLGSREGLFSQRMKEWSAATTRPLLWLVQGVVLFSVTGTLLGLVHPGILITWFILLKWCCLVLKKIYSVYNFHQNKSERSAISGMIWEIHFLIIGEL